MNPWLSSVAAASRRARRFGRAALVLALSCALPASLLAGCGQKGPLVLPPAAASAPSGR
jgi:predicted small lipoprotein YifL